MYRYQIWDRDKWGHRNGSPEEVVYSLDQALLRAKAISKKAIYVPNAMIEPFGPVGASVFPMIFVLDCCQAPSKLRGFAHKGKWKDAVDNCNSCHNMAYNEDDCKACGASCWSPYRK